MIKYFCDRCGKEKKEDELNKVALDFNEDSYWPPATKFLCAGCINALLDFFKRVES
jgi:hypothetical protein